MFAKLDSFIIPTIPVSLIIYKQFNKRTFKNAYFFRIYAAVNQEMKKRG